MVSASSAVSFELDEHCLANGLRVILQPDSSAPLVALHVMYHVGSKNERQGRTGFAHLFEHLLFQGSAHVRREEHFKYIQDAGGTLNGTTWFDRTNYFETLPANELDLGLWLEADRMGFFKPGITQEKLDNQRDVVKNERLQSYENRPYGLALETVLEYAYPEGHPYRHPTIGYMTDIDAAARIADIDVYRGGPGAGRSDESSFIDKRIPALHFFTGFHDDYHRPSDDWDRIDVDGTARVATFALELAARIAARQDRPRFGTR